MASGGAARARGGGDRAAAAGGGQPLLAARDQPVADLRPARHRRQPHHRLLRHGVHGPGGVLRHRRLHLGVAHDAPRRALAGCVPGCGRDVRDSWRDRRPAVPARAQRLPQPHHHRLQPDVPGGRQCLVRPHSRADGPAAGAAHHAVRLGRAHRSRHLLGGRCGRRLMCLGGGAAGPRPCGAELGDDPRRRGRGPGARRRRRARQGHLVRRWMRDGRARRQPVRALAAPRGAGCVSCCRRA